MSAAEIASGKFDAAEATLGDAVRVAALVVVAVGSGRDCKAATALLVVCTNALFHTHSALSPFPTPLQSERKADSVDIIANKVGPLFLSHVLLVVQGILSEGTSTIYVDYVTGSVLTHTGIYLLFTSFLFFPQT
jgi:hypothetical protein